MKRQKLEVGPMTTDKTEQPAFGFRPSTFDPPKRAAFQNREINNLEKSIAFLSFFGEEDDQEYHFPCLTNAILVILFPPDRKQEMTAHDAEESRGEEERGVRKSER